MGDLYVLADVPLLSDQWDRATTRVISRSPTQDVMPETLPAHALFRSLFGPLAFLGSASMWSIPLSALVFCKGHRQSPGVNADAGVRLCGFGTRRGSVLFCSVWFCCSAVM